MFNKKLLAASMAAAISSGMVAQTHAIQVQENDLGQLLLAPTYMTSGELRTDITVVNTRTDAAVKAKIVFRNGLDSAEVLDFILYLSPGDVWRGSVAGEANAARIESTDDSMTDNGGNFGSAANPISQPFFDKTSSGQNGIGHFEVYGLYSVAVGSYPATAGAIQVIQGMSKPDLRAVFETVSTFGGPGSDASPLSNSDTPTNLQMMGEVQIVNGANGLVSYNIPALGPTSYATPCGADNCVVENTNYDATVGAPTDIGQSMGVLGADNIIAIETALAAQDISFPYSTENGSISIPAVAFVTKYRHLSDVCASGATTVVDGYYPPFEPTITGEVTITTTSYDNEEGSQTVIVGQFSGGSEAPPSSLPYELNFLDAIGYHSTSGWTNIGFRAVEPGCSYAGAPVISAVLKNEGAGLYWNATGDRRQGM